MKGKKSKHDSCISYSAYTLISIVLYKIFNNRNFFGFYKKKKKYIQKNDNKNKNINVKGT